MSTVSQIRPRSEDRTGFPRLTEGKRPKKWENRRSRRGEIDTLGVAFEVTDFEPVGASVQVSGWGTDQAQHRYSQKLPSGGFVAFGVSEKAWVEASLPKRTGDDNVHALPVGEALEVAREMVREACEHFVTPAKEHRFELAKVVRIDAPRDFDDVWHQALILDGLAAVPREKRHKVRRFADAKSGGAETLRVGPRAWGAQLYDKHAETLGIAPKGRLRFEPRLHSEQLTSSWAQKEGITMRQVGDITEEKVSRLTESMFRRAAFDREVCSTEDVAAAVFDPSNGLSPTVQSRLWAFLTAPAIREGMSKNTVSKYRRLARSIGVAPVIDLPKGTLGVRLDLERGTEVLRAA